MEHHLESKPHHLQYVFWTILLDSIREIAACNPTCAANRSC